MLPTLQAFDSPRHQVNEQYCSKGTEIRLHRKVALSSWRMAYGRPISFVALVLYGAALLGGEDQKTKLSPVLTVCQALQGSGRYGGKAIIVVGRSTGTDEGSWLDENCGLEVIVEGRKYPTSISTAYVASQFAPPPQKPRDFKSDKPLLKRTLAEVQSTTHLEHHARWFAGLWAARDDPDPVTDTQERPDYDHFGIWPSGGRSSSDRRRT